MKKGKNVDEGTKSGLSSMKTAENVDGRLENKLPSMKSGKIMDERYKKAPKVSELRTFGADMLFSTA